MEEVIGSLAVAAVVVSFPLILVEEDLEVLMLEEEMEVELLQQQMVVMPSKIPVEVVADQAMHLLLMETTQALAVLVSSSSHTQPDKYLKT